MRSYRSSILITAFGVPVLFGLWLLFLLLRSGDLSDAPGYPFSVIIPGAGLILFNLGWSIKSLLSAVGSQRIPRTLSVIAASLLAVGLLASLRDLFAPMPDRTTSSATLTLLVLSVFILSSVASFVAGAWGKTNLQAWLRVIGAACISSVLLFVFLLMWSTWR